ncbi:unnamed protein product [Candida parapsilosis]
MKLPSLKLHENKPMKLNKNWILCELPGVRSTPVTSTTCMWYNTQDVGFLEMSTSTENIKSKSNAKEVLVVKHHIKNLFDNGILEHHIGVIAPYSSQMQLLKSELKPHQSIDIKHR